MAAIFNFSKYSKQVEYAYQEMPHSENTASPHSQEERKREPAGLPPWNGQWQNNLSLGV
jgi:hypothetical protein